MNRQLVDDVEDVPLRGVPIDRVDVPMLFLQGTRDNFARLDLITDVCEELEPNATLHVVDGGDHSFAVPKRSGRTPTEVMGELVDTTVDVRRGGARRR